MLFSIMPAIEPPRTKKRLPNRRGRTRFPGIVEHAVVLGVNVSHLYRVLIGERPSASLKRRYAALLAEEKGAAR